MSDDWDRVTVIRKKAPTARTGKEAVAAAVRMGAEVVVEKKFDAGKNKGHGHPPSTDLRKVDAETEDFHHKEVPLELRIKLQQARMAKKWTQKDLATAIQEKPGVINDYEAGRAIPSPAIIVKMERALGVKLK